LDLSGLYVASNIDISIFISFSRFLSWHFSCLCVDFIDHIAYYVKQNYILYVVLQLKMLISFRD
jgi:hypothetical protein